MDVAECLSVSQLIAIISLVILAYCSLAAIRLSLSILAQAAKLAVVAAIAMVVVQYGYPTETFGITRHLSTSIEPYLAQISGAGVGRLFELLDYTSRNHSTSLPEQTQTK